ncbi:hypothetical protein GW17_00051867, partial [Ensete ventricosum]
GNVEIAEIAAQHLLQLNPEDSGIYSIMSDVYATAKRWEDVVRIRKLMDDKRVKKNVGCTQHLLQLNPEDSGNYSVVTDVYATAKSAKRWEDVARIRKLMGDKRVKKNVGCRMMDRSIAD